MLPFRGTEDINNEIGCAVDDRGYAFKVFRRIDEPAHHQKLRDPIQIPVTRSVQACNGIKRAYSRRAAARVQVELPPKLANDRIAAVLDRCDTGKLDEAARPYKGQVVGGWRRWPRQRHAQFRQTLLDQSYHRLILVAPTRTQAPPPGPANRYQRSVDLREGRQPESHHLPCRWEAKYLAALPVSQARCSAAVSDPSGGGRHQHGYRFVRPVAGQW